MSIVERLAAKWGLDAVLEDDRRDARWWLRAIAEEIEHEAITGWHGPTDISDWLRKQADKGDG